MPKISALPSATHTRGNDQLPINHTDDSTTEKATVSMIMPTGSIMDFAGSTAPTGWLMCYGQTLNAVTSPQYQALYNVIGNTYGGSSNTDFKVPDLRGRVIAGKDDMGGASANRLTNQSGGLDGDVLGASGGSETHTLTLAQIPNSSGTLQAHSSRSAWWAPTGGFSGSSMAGNYSPPSGAVGGANSVNVMQFSTGGGGGAHNNVQPTLILNKIIRY